MTKWLPHQEKILRELWPTELRCIAIAGRIGHSVSSVQHRAAKFGLKKRNKGNPHGFKKPTLVKHPVTIDCNALMNRVTAPYDSELTLKTSLQRSPQEKLTIAMNAIENMWVLALNFEYMEDEKTEALQAIREVAEHVKKDIA